jgi:drug/metabolite transporter (DMT)-like permease
VPASALAFALAAAFVHALWNILLARARNPEAATAVALLVAVVVFAPVAAAVWNVDSRVWPFLVGTSVFELVYFALLAGAYRRAHLSVVYPLARGTAPVLVLVVGVVALGAETSWRQVGGVVLVAAGVLLVRGARLRGGSARDVLFWLPIAGCIATYTLIDKHGIRYSTPLVYLELSMIVPAVGYATFVAVAQGRESLRAGANGASALAGLATFGAYALVLAALERASAASVAAVRETSVVIATALAAVVLKEPVGRVRLGGAVLVAGGVALISLT